MNAFSGVLISVAVATNLSMGAPSSGPSNYMEFPHALPGRILKISKVLNEATGKVEMRMENGEKFWADDLYNLEIQEEKARKGQRGALDKDLVDRLPGLYFGEKVKVIISLKYPPISYPDKTKNSTGVLMASSMAASRIQPLVSIPELIRKHGIPNCRIRGNSLVSAEVDMAQLMMLKQDANIASVREEIAESPLGPDISTLAASAFNPGPVPSGSGSGVKAATFDHGLSQSFLNCIGISPVAWDSYLGYADPYDIRHSNATFKCLAAGAPSASLYHRAALNYESANEVAYIINNGIQTLSLSRTRGNTSPFHSTYSEFLVMDDFAYRYPYPVFVNPTGNSGYQFEANWQCYNAVSVGNVRHTNGSTYQMGDCTHAKNPPPVYGGTISGTGAGDREMPYLIAPGLPSTDATFATTCMEGSGQLNCGTSWSAAVVNGMAASVISADGRMVGWPEKVRAALILTAQNVDGGEWASNTDGRDGAGAISATEAVGFAKNHTSVSPNNSATQKGMYAGSIYPGDFSAPNILFNYSVPNPKPSGRHLRVVLTWDSNPIVGGGVNALSDLDMTVSKNSGSKGSYSWDGNVEVVDIPASEVNAGSSYVISIDPLTNRIPASGSRANYLYYAVAWDWVKDHAP